MPVTAFFRRCLTAALLCALSAADPASGGAQQPTPRPYTLTDIEGMLKNRVPQRRILDLAGRRCLDFVLDSRSEGRLRAVGAGQQFVDQLREVCNPNVPRATGPAAAPAGAPAPPVETPLPVSFVVAIVAPDLTVRPIPQHDLLVIGPRGDTTRLATSLQGEASGSFLPGIYRIESAQAVEVLGARYRWAMYVPIQAGVKSIELTQRNATIEQAVAAAAATPPAADTATPPPAAQPAPTAPARSRRSEEAELFEKYRSGLFLVFGSEERCTGFYADSAGLVLTQAEIIRGSDDIRVQVDSATKLRARVIAQDTLLDVALLSINPARCAKCAVLPVFDTAKGPVATIGERVLAAGSPLNRGNLMSIGIVNSVDASGVTSDVTIAYANSGGPLLNLDGEVVAVNLFRDGRRPGRPKVSISLPVTAVLPLLARGRAQIASAPPPTDSLLPLPPADQFPAEPIAAMVAQPQLDLKRYRQDAGRYKVFAMTPPVIGWRQARAQEELNKRRQQGRTRGIVDDRIDPIQGWRDWSDHLSLRRAVVALSVVPGSMDFPSYDPERAPNVSEGSVRRVKLFRDGVEVVPIETVRFPAALGGAERLALGRPIPYQVVNVYRAESFGPKPDGSPASFAVAVQDMDAAVMGNPVPLDRRIVEAIIKDFTPFFVGLRSR